MKGLFKFTSWLLIFTIIGIIYFYEKAKSLIKEAYREIKQKTQSFERSGYFYYHQLNSIDEMLEVLHRELQNMK